MNFVGIRLAGKAVCCAPLFTASDEKSRQILTFRCASFLKSVTPFALGRPQSFFPCGATVELTQTKVLALTSGRFTPCGALRCGLRSYCLGAPLSRLAPPATPHASRGALARTK
jgi:hypothetical protein